MLHADWRLSGDEKEEDDEDETDGNGDQALDLQSGHGTFISGIVRRLCPTAEIHIDGVLSSLGDGDDVSIADGPADGRSDASRTASTFDVIVMSLGAYTLDDEPPPLATAIAELVEPDKTLVVAAAGNAGSCRPYWPAALPGVVAVGALDSGGRAWFSNYGGWVDACAPGVDVRSTFYGTDDDPLQRAHRRPDDGLFNEFKGWATWSGTSFAAPKVAAVIAHEAARLGISAPEAWKRLSHYRHFRYPDLGVVFNVL